MVEGNLVGYLKPSFFLPYGTPITILACLLVALVGGATLMGSKTIVEKLTRTKKFDMKQLTDTLFNARIGANLAVVALALYAIFSALYTLIFAVKLHIIKSDMIFVVASLTDFASMAVCEYFVHFAIIYVFAVLASGTWSAFTVTKDPTNTVYAFPMVCFAVSVGVAAAMAAVMLIAEVFFLTSLVYLILAITLLAYEVTISILICKKDKSLLYRSTIYHVALNVIMYASVAIFALWGTLADGSTFVGAIWAGFKHYYPDFDHDTIFHSFFVSLITTHFIRLVPQLFMYSIVLIRVCATYFAIAVPDVDEAEPTQGVSQLADDGGSFAAF
ncbi:hypothetical protein J8273_1524 [Carpediemonas membranifera]|uniref:Uncharacterized protein n=1 Tax=Carpediemonas membranifera TaxID=201153 RepID=A0A8J6AWD8_9EUKA|nr:hypothetical protein J8273_1524 [Carpediemonas membranifera]|eukprot:KAG9396526.1 hypothetical protein J8273_1524 [Carpediemonas membranifera]